MSMSRAEAEDLFQRVLQREDALAYARNVPGFWEAWSRGDLAGAVTALRAFLAHIARPDLLNGQPELAQLLTEKLNAIVGAP